MQVLTEGPLEGFFLVESLPEEKVWICVLCACHKPVRAGSKSAHEFGWGSNSYSHMYSVHGLSKNNVKDIRSTARKHAVGLCAAVQARDVGLAKKRWEILRNDPLLARHSTSRKAIDTHEWVVLAGCRLERIARAGTSVRANENPAINIRAAHDAGGDVDNKNVVGDDVDMEDDDANIITNDADCKLDAADVGNVDGGDKDLGDANVGDGNANHDDVDDTEVSGADVGDVYMNASRAPAPPRHRAAPRGRPFKHEEPNDAAAHDGDTKDARAHANPGRAPVPAPRDLPPRRRPVIRGADVIDLTEEVEPERPRRGHHPRSVSPAHRSAGLWPAGLQPPAGKPIGMREFCKRYHVAPHVCDVLIDAGYVHSGTLSYIGPRELNQLDLENGKVAQLKFAVDSWVASIPRGGDGRR